MLEYLFRVEAVNLNATVCDTADISTTRGGGFYLLDRVHTLAENPTYKDYVITEGASTAVLKMATDEPGEKRREILDFLYGNKEGPPIKEMMFLVEYVPYEGSFPENMARLLGKLRVAQMQSPSVRIFPETLAPGTDTKGSRLTFDDLNRVLPSHTIDSVKGPVSYFTDKRLQQGRTLREKIYRTLLGENLKGYGFTDDFEKLSLDSSQGNLNGKIAFIHVDGNKFGKLQQDFSEPQLKEYDQKLQDFKKAFLRRVLGLAKEFRSFLTGSAPELKIRLETLLWGGDEMKLVVPGWLGWKVAELFFSTVQGCAMTLDVNGKPHDLTYSMGLVFAHHKNRIRNLNKVTESLVKAAKDGLDEVTAYVRSEGDRMNCLVLESLETLPSDYSAFAEEVYRTDSLSLCFSPTEMAALKRLALLLGVGFPRSRLHTITRALLGNKVKTFVECVQDGLDLSDMPPGDKSEMIRMIGEVTGTQIEDGKVKKAMPQKSHRWLQVAELWDYLVWKEK